MSNAREQILARLRQNHPQPSSEPLEPWQPDAASLGLTTLEAKLDCFSRRMQAVRAEVHQVKTSDWPERLKQLVEERKLRRLLYAPDGRYGKPLEAIWEAEQSPLQQQLGPVESYKRELFYEIDGTITSARGGIAETGSLILWPTPEEPRSWSLVPPLQIVLLEAESLYATFAEAMDSEKWSEKMPTNALLISGPSKSADIEQTLAYGVHGPVELVVLLLL